MTFGLPIRLYYLLLIVIGIPLSLHSKQQKIENIATSITIKKNRLEVEINDDFKEEWLRSNFFAQYEEDINLEALPCSLVLLPFILNIYPVIWISGKDYLIDCMDKDIYESLEKIKTVLKRLYPNTPLEGNLIPKRLETNKPLRPLVDPTTNAAVLFSGGLDSTVCSLQHREKQQLLITAQGQADLPMRKKSLWRKLQTRCMDFAEEHGHTNAFVRSNYTEFLNLKVLNKVSPEIISWRVDTTEGIGLFGVVAPILFTKGYSQLIIGSSFTWNFPFPNASNPLVDHHLKAATFFNLYHEHYTLTRFEKIKFMVDLIKKEKLKRPFLKVCSRKKTGGNCRCGCTKCQTVILGLVALGEDPALYGFNITPEDALEITEQRFDEKPQGYWANWNFHTMQETLLSSVPLSAKFKRQIRWMLTCDFMTYTPLGRLEGKTEVQWLLFKDIAPESVTIPSFLEKKEDKPTKEPHTPANRRSLRTPSPRR